LVVLYITAIRKRGKLTTGKKNTKNRDQLSDRLEGQGKGGGGEKGRKKWKGGWHVTVNCLDQVAEKKKRKKRRWRKGRKKR